MRLEEWYSPRVKLAGWEPDFLKQLDQWLSANRSNIQPGGGPFALYKSLPVSGSINPSYPSFPPMDNVHLEIIRHAFRYEKDMGHGGHAASALNR